MTIVWRQLVIDYWLLVIGYWLLIGDVCDMALRGVARHNWGRGPYLETPS
jgi:hypothetical protein